MEAGIQDHYAPENKYASMPLWLLLWILPLTYKQLYIKSKYFKGALVSLWLPLPGVPVHTCFPHSVVLITSHECYETI